MSEIKEESVGFDNPLGVDAAEAIQTAGETIKESKPEPVELTIKDMSGNEIVVPFLPNPKCKKCFGRGYIGRNVLKDLPVLCPKCYKI